MSAPAPSEPVPVGARPGWWWRLGGRGMVAHRFVDTEPACGEPSGPRQWTRAPATAKVCPGCLGRPMR
jgi:hypothetical protein